MLRDRARGATAPASSGGGDRRRGRRASVAAVPPRPALVDLGDRATFQDWLAVAGLDRFAASLETFGVRMCRSEAPSSHPPATGSYLFSSSSSSSFFLSFLCKRYPQLPSRAAVCPECPPPRTQVTTVESLAASSHDDLYLRFNLGLDDARELAR